MRVFFCLCYPDLFQTVLCNDIAQCISKIIVFKNHMYVFERMIILRHRGIIQMEFMHATVGEILLGKHFCDLAAPIRAKVKTYSGVTIFDGGYWLTVVGYYNGGFNEFIGNISLVRCF